MAKDGEFLKAKQFLTNHLLGSIATINPQTHSPESALVYFWYDLRTHLYIATLTESRKATNVSSSSAVAIDIGDEDTGETMQIEGNAHLVVEKQESLIALESLHKKIQQHHPKMILWPMLQLRPHDITIIKVSISWFRYSSFIDPIFTVEGASTDLIVKNAENE